MQLHASIVALLWFCAVAVATAATQANIPPTPTYAPSSAYSSQTCSDAQEVLISDLFVAAATSADCKQYATAGGYSVSIFAPCTSSCVTTRYESLANAVPDCFLSSPAYEMRNKKEQLLNALLNCTTANTTTAAEMSLYLSLSTPNTVDDQVKKIKSSNEVKSTAIALGSSLLSATSVMAAMSMVYLATV